jgi:hypothetical protein
VPWNLIDRERSLWDMSERGDVLRKMLRCSDTGCKRCLEQGTKGKRRRSEEILCVREGFCAYAEVAIRMEHEGGRLLSIRGGRKYV